ncbi:hypothetical protein [Modicisalibacter sp. 'Wilcox']|uniref:hypothetical protein n=1 Tax=Modicisalibacter sp. 'Wilcox' TaxID=2679914 RepID=UPI0013D34AD9|nr:hypothetical protein [Modicisalibacter sp. 'Wilcox']
MTTTIYAIDRPFADGTVEVYGEPDMGWYEWRIIERGDIIHDSGKHGTSGMQYGSPAIALRDALNHVEPPTQEPALVTPISWVPGRDALSENLTQVNRLADVVRGMATALIDETANAKTLRSVMNPDHPNGRLGMVYTDTRVQHAERVAQVLNKAADDLRDLAHMENEQ